MNTEHPDYWESHKRILKEEMEKLDTESYYEICNNLNSPLLIELDKKVKERLKSITA